ncbi:MAG TPA: DUF1731 domain-containing protein [Blastocatellia bacterium]|nr:DUF1731 domain-containing protein [Blastocatellia bacterium]
MKIIIPGGSGQVGAILSRAFHRAGHEVVILSRRPAKAAWRVMEWDARTLGDWTTVIEGADAVINLKSRRVIPGRLTQSKFIFRFPTWAEAAQDLCERWREAY